MAQQPFPQVVGRHRLTPAWSVDLPVAFYRRVEEGDLVLWRADEPRITLWIAVWNTPDAAREQTRDAIAADRSPDALQTYEWERPGLLGYAYLLDESGPDVRRWALYTFTIADADYVQMAVYCDREADLPMAQHIWRSVDREA